MSQVKNCGIIMVVASLIAGCAGSEATPVGTGEGLGPEGFPVSPCACVEIEQAPVTPEYIEKLKAWIG